MRHLHLPFQRMAEGMTKVQYLTYSVFLRVLRYNTLLHRHTIRDKRRERSCIHLIQIVLQQAVPQSLTVYQTRLQHLGKAAEELLGR